MGERRQNLGLQAGPPETAGTQAAMFVSQGATKATENTAVPVTNFRPIIRATAMMCHKDRRDESYGHYVMSLG